MPRTNEDVGMSHSLNLRSVGVMKVMYIYVFYRELIILKEEIVAFLS